MSKGVSAICSVFFSKYRLPVLIFYTDRMSTVRSQLTDVVDFASFRGAMFSYISQFEASVSSLYPISSTASSAGPRKRKLIADH
jgi:hypothetical protein